MTIPFFIFTIRIEKRKKAAGTKDPKYHRTPEEEWFDRKMMYMSRF
ncbi:hypothetical protein [Thalassobacillus devorans]|nr:hypothetical protein [Thalassobacillus devorans]